MPETKHFYKNVALLIVLNALVKPLWIFGIDRGVQNLSAGHDYGIFYTLYSFSLLFAIIPDMGLANYNGSLLARSPAVLRKYWPGMWGLKILLGLTYLLVVAIAGWFAGYENQFSLLMVIALNHVLVINLSFFRSYVNGLHLYKLDSFFSILDKAVMVLLCLPLVLHPWFRGERLIWGYVWGQTLGFLAGNLVMYWNVAKRAGTWKPKFQVERLLPVFKTTLPFAFLGLLTSFYTRLDAVLLEKILPDGAYQVDIYAAAYRLTDAFQMLPVLLSSFLLPAFASKLRTPAALRPFVEIAWQGLLVAGGILALTGWCFGEPIMRLLYHDYNPQHATSFAWLMTAFMPLSLTYVFGTLLTAGHYTRPLLRIAGFGLLCNLGFNLVLIPLYKAEGAALASCLTHLPVVIFQIISCGKREGHFLRLNRVLAWLTWLAGSGLVFVFLRNSTLAWGWAWIIATATSGLSALLFGIVPFKAMFALSNELADSAENNLADAP